MQKQGILLESGTNELELLSFFLGDQQFGINVAKVQALVLFEPELLTAIQTGQPAMLGMLLHRGKTIPLLDLAVALDRKSSAHFDRRIVIVTEFNNAVHGFLVDGMDRIHRLSWRDFVPLNNMLGVEMSVTGSVNLAGTEVLVLDMELIISRMLYPQGFTEISGEAAEAEHVKQRGNISIYFAEDSGSIRKNVVRLLAAAGYADIKAFENGHDALERLQDIVNTAGNEQNQGRALPDVVVSDIEMPKMDGLSLCRHIKNNPALESIPVIMFSSLITDQMIDKCKSVGADGYVAKPEMQELAALLDKVCL